MRFSARWILASALLLASAGTALAQKPVPPEPGGVGVTPGEVVMIEAITGTVASVTDAGILVKPYYEGTSPALVVVPKDLPIIREEDVDLSALAVGDGLTVNGLPKGIVAQTLQQANVAPGPAPTPMPAPLPAQPAGNGGPLPPEPAPTKLYPSATAWASGTVASVDKTSRIVVLTLADGSPLSVDVPEGVKVHRTVTTDLSGVKVGDDIFASGTQGQDVGGTRTINAAYVREGEPGTLFGGVGTGVVVAPAPPTPGPVEGGSGVATPPATGAGSASMPMRLLPGNLSGSGHITVADAMLALRFATGLAQPNAAQLLAGDLFGEGRITVRSAMLILRAAVGLTSL